MFTLRSYYSFTLTNKCNSEMIESGRKNFELVSKLLTMLTIAVNLRIL